MTISTINVSLTYHSKQKTGVVVLHMIIDFPSVENCNFIGSDQRRILNRTQLLHIIFFNQ